MWPAVSHQHGHWHQQGPAVLHATWCHQRAAVLNQCATTILHNFRLPSFVHCVATAICCSNLYCSGQQRSRCATKTCKGSSRRCSWQGLWHASSNTNMTTYRCALSHLGCFPVLPWPCVSPYQVYQGRVVSASDVYLESAALTAPPGTVPLCNLPELHCNHSPGQEVSCCCVCCPPNVTAAYPSWHN